MDATSGHNSYELTRDERRALMMHHLRAVSDQQAICERENDERKRLRKLAKTDGVNLKDLDYGLHILKTEDPNIIIDELKLRAEMAEWMGVIPGTQAEFDFEREPATDRAFREGLAAGSLGKDNDPPYGSPSALYDAWRDGWRQGQDSILAAFQSANEKLQKQREDKGVDAEFDEESETEGSA